MQTFHFFPFNAWFFSPFQFICLNSEGQKKNCQPNISNGGKNDEIVDRKRLKRIQLLFGCTNISISKKLFAIEKNCPLISRKCMVQFTSLIYYWTDWLIQRKSAKYSICLLFSSSVALKMAMYVSLNVCTLYTTIHPPSVVFVHDRRRSHQAINIFVCVCLTSQHDFQFNLVLFLSCRIKLPINSHVFQYTMRIKWWQLGSMKYSHWIRALFIDLNF